MRFWSRFLYAGQKTFAASSRGRWFGYVEIGVASALILGGFVFLVAVLAFQYFERRQTDDFELYTTGELAIRISLAILALGLGAYRLFLALWRVSASRERREALASAVGELDLFREERTSGTAASTIPKFPHPIRAGTQLPFLLPSRRRTYGWLLLAAIAMLAGFLIATISAIRLARSLAIGIDFAAIAMGGVALGIGIWAAIAFFRQALRLSAFGTTNIEISMFPLQPGQKCRFFLRQPGRFRFKLLEVLLICEEISTFTRGTDIQTERRVVQNYRLLRQRGVDVSPTAKFECDFEFEIPESAPHSFASKNNQIQWKIVVHTHAKGWPHFEQSFPVIVAPPKANGHSPSPAIPSA